MQILKAAGITIMCLALFAALVLMILSFAH